VGAESASRSWWNSGTAGTLACALAVVAAVGVSSWNLLGELGPTLDDSYIHLQFAQSLARGDGMAFRAGEWVSGSTGPLWTALLAIASGVPGAAVPWSLFLGCGFYLLAALELRRLLACYRLEGALVALGVVLFVFSDLMLWAAWSGMEIALFVYLSTLGMRLHADSCGKRGWPRAAVVFAVACLARPEGALLLTLATGEHLARLRQRGKVEDAVEGPGRHGGRRGTWRHLLLEGTTALALSALVLLPFALFGWWSAGDPLPTTFSVKTDAASRFYPAWRDLWRASEVLFRSLPLSMIFAGAGASWLFVNCLAGPRAEGSEPRESAPSWLPLLWWAGLPLAYSSLTAAGSQMPLGNFGRYVFPLVPATIVLGCLGLSAPYAAIRETVRRRLPDLDQRLVAALLVLVLLAPTAFAARNGVGRLQRNMYDVRVGDVAMALWVRQNVAPGVVLGAQDIGALGFFTENPIFDLVGIVDPRVIPVVKGGGDGMVRLRRLLEMARDDGVGLLVLFPESYGGEAALQAAVPGTWRTVHAIDIPGNITLAGSRLVALVPPWARTSQP
jgi:hypothetical protein